MCQHRYSSVIQYKGFADELYIEFVGFQCDDCGMLLNRDVGAADLAFTPATLDTKAYEHGLARAIMSLFESPEVERLKQFTGMVRL